MSQQIHCNVNRPFVNAHLHLLNLTCLLFSLSSPHLGGKQFAHVTVGVPCAQSQLRGPSLRPQQVPLGFRWAVDLVVDILASVHVEAGVEEGAVAEALVRVLVDDAAEGERLER